MNDVKISTEDIGILNVLIANRQQYVEDVKRSQGHINAFLFRCAQAHGLNPEEYKFSDTELSFVPLDSKVVVTE